MPKVIIENNKDSTITIKHAVDWQDQDIELTLDEPGIKVKRRKTTWYIPVRVMFALQAYVLDYQAQRNGITAIKSPYGTEPAKR